MTKHVLWCYRETKHVLPCYCTTRIWPSTWYADNDQIYVQQAYDRPNDTQAKYLSLLFLAHEWSKRCSNHGNHDRHHSNGERADGSRPAWRNFGATYPQLCATPCRAARGLREPFREKQTGWEAWVPPAHPQRVQNETRRQGQQPLLKASCQDRAPQPNNLGRH